MILSGFACGCFSLLRLGSKGMVTYRDVHEQLPRAVHMLASGGFWVPREVLSRFLDSILQTPQGQRLKLAGTRDLSAREQQTLDFLLENLANKEIAAKMNISERTREIPRFEPAPSMEYSGAPTSSSCVISAAPKPEDETLQDDCAMRCKTPVFAAHFFLTLGSTSDKPGCSRPASGPMILNPGR